MGKHNRDRPVVVKVGGSLFDRPRLGPQLQRWLAHLQESSAILVPGGGVRAEVVRVIDRQQQLGEDASHWLALQAMALNARMLAEILPAGQVTETLGGCVALWQAGRVPILDGYAFARADEGQPGALPHSWDVTSDSVALRVASVANAGRVILLKSADLAADGDWLQASRAGFVDRYFPTLVAGAGDIEVSVVNFRSLLGGA